MISSRRRVYNLMKLAQRAEFRKNPVRRWRDRRKRRSAMNAALLLGGLAATGLGVAALGRDIRGIHKRQKALNYLSNNKYQAPRPKTRSTTYKYESNLGEILENARPTNNRQPSPKRRGIDLLPNVSI